MNNEELYNDGISLLNNLFEKFIKQENLSNEEAKKYRINYPDSYYHFEEISSDYDEVLINFPIYYLTGDKEYTINRYLGVLLSKSEIKKEIIIEEMLNFNINRVIKKDAEELAYENNEYMISLMAELYYVAKNVSKYAAGSDEQKKACDLYYDKIDEYKDKLKDIKNNNVELKKVNEKSDPVDENGNDIVPELIVTQSNTVVDEKNNKITEKILNEKDDNTISEKKPKESLLTAEDEYEKIIKRLDFGNSEKKAYTFNWDETDLLNYADDSSIEIAVNIAERANISLDIVESNTSICITSTLYGLCGSNMTNDDYFKEIEKNKNYLKRKDAQTWKCKMGEPMSTLGGGCEKCKYQSCPKFLAAYLIYLKNQGKLKEKLIERKKFRETNDVKNGFFLFEWKNKNGLKNIDENSFQYANELVNKDYVRLGRSLVENELYIKALCLCKEMQLSGMDISKTIPTHENWNKVSYILRSSNCATENLCTSYSCRLQSCPLVVAAYIYYLKMSGQEDKIKEDREYYLLHKEEMDRETEERVKKKLDEIKALKEEKIQKVKDSYDGKIENLNYTLNSILESNKTSFHCIVVGDEKEEQDEFIEKIIELLRQNNKLPNIRRMPASHLARLYYHYSGLRINKDEQLVYSDNEIEEKISFKRDENGVRYNSDTKANRKNVLEKNAVYVLDCIQDFIDDVHHYSKRTDFTMKTK